MADKNSLQQLGPIPSRLTVGFILFYHAAVTFGVFSHSTVESGIMDFAHRLGTSGYAAATTVAWVVTIVNFVGGPMILLGLFTRPVAFLVALFATSSLVFGPQVFAAADVTSGTISSQVEVVLLVLAGALTLVALGSGPLSADAAIEARRARKKAGH